MFIPTADHARHTLDRLKRGERVITNDQTLEAIIDTCQDDEARHDIRSIPNPRQLGTLDQYLAWIGPTTNPDDR